MQIIAWFWYQEGILRRQQASQWFLTLQIFKKSRTSSSACPGNHFWIETVAKENNFIVFISLNSAKS